MPRKENYCSLMYCSYSESKGDVDFSRLHCSTLECLSSFKHVIDILTECFLSCKGNECKIFMLNKLLFAFYIWLHFVSHRVYLVSYDHRSYGRNLSNCVQKPEKVRTSMGFEAVTLRYRCDALTNRAMKPLTLGAGHL